MSSKRRSRSRERGKMPSSSKLRMDTKPIVPRLTDPSVPAGRRREIDNVMKKARASPNSNTYWDKKLLEVEAKDPNRWRHSGYKSMYIDGSSPSLSPPPRGALGGGRRTSRSRSRSYRSRSRSPRSPPPSARRGGGGSPRSPPPRNARARSRSNSRQMKPRPRTPPGGSGGTSRRPRSPPPGRAGGGVGRAASPPPRSASSVSSCSDDSCSVCSPKNRRGRSRSRSFSPPPQPPRRPVVNNSKSSSNNNNQHPPTAGPSSKKLPPSSNIATSRRPPSPSFSPPPNLPPVDRRGRRPPRTPPPASSVASDRPTDPRRQPPPPLPLTRGGQVIDIRGQSSTGPPPPNAKQTAKARLKETPLIGEGGQVLLTRIKKEKTRKRAGSPGDSSGSEDSSASSSGGAIVATTRLTLSERFGKMAQWSVDRERRDNIENMRITKTGGDLKVMIEDDLIYPTTSPPARYSISPVPQGHFPDELARNSTRAGWDDVRVRYQYYKDLGYLRDLSLDDYVKWEEWWYKYQDWLANERHYERWLSQRGTVGHHHHHHHHGGGRRGRRGGKRAHVTQRLN